MKIFSILLALFLFPAPMSWAELQYSHCMSPARLPEPAKRIVTLDINSTELALALGLQDSMVGVAGLEGPHQIMSEYKIEAKKLNYISPFYPTLAQLQTVTPDLIIGGWRNGFSHGTAIEPESLQSKGMGAYVLRETCATESGHVPAHATFEKTLITDLIELGRITATETRAAQLVEQMKDRLARVTADVALHGRPEPVRILVYDGGVTEALSIGREALLSEAIRIAGGRNIFDDRNGTWQSMAWDEVIGRNPELIVIVDYGAGDAAFKIQDILLNPDLQSIDAVRNKRYFIIPYAAAISGIRSVGLTELLADHLICTFPNFSQGVTSCLDVPSAL
jgi:iron complex transport system substrate-binding protein